MRKIIFIFSILLFLFGLSYFCYYFIFVPFIGVGLKGVLSELKYKDNVLGFVIFAILLIILPYFFVVTSFKFMENRSR